MAIEADREMSLVSVGVSRNDRCKPHRAMAS